MGRTLAARAAWRGGRYKEAQRAVREQGRSKAGLASLLHIKLVPMSAPGPTGERQEHLDAVVAFAGAGQRRRMVRVLDVLTVSTRNFLKKEEEPTKMFDDDEWIRSFTEAEAMTLTFQRGK